MNMKKHLAPACMALALFTAGPAIADLVATDLNTGGTDMGFSGGWVGSANRMPIKTNDLAYANYSITQTGTMQYVYDGDNTHPDRMDSRDLAAAMSGEIWFSLLVNVPAGGGFAGISFHTNTLAQSAYDYSHNQYLGVRVVMSTNQLWVDWQGAAVGAAWTPDATAGSYSTGTHLILGKMIVGGGNDTLNIWVDPDLRAVTKPAGLPAATYSNATVDFFKASVVRIGLPLWIGGKDTADAIWLSNTATAFYEVTGCTPPPGGTLVLLW